MSGLSAYVTLFFTAFTAATLLPAQSEAVLAAYLIAGKHPVALLVLAASLGNVLGSFANWLLGRGIDRFETRRWFPVSPAAMERAKAHYARWGYWSLLASWVPLIGDPLTVVAGVLREPLGRFLLLVTIAKTGRYILLAAALRAGWS